MKIVAVAMLVLAPGFAACSPIERKSEMESSNPRPPVNAIGSMGTVSLALER
ncbi:hypothetical protein P0D88_30215 [Paraburkholderia sp. RL18-103-BIB-C]|jgi:hypothetical protein|uniref:hypothetical protein n=1 Tax=unclassified Paraburkholderia TaxID=2615204 RepID=UPI002F670B0B